MGSSGFSSGGFGNTDWNTHVFGTGPEPPTPPATPCPPSLVTAADYINNRILRHMVALRPGYTSSPEMQLDILTEWIALIDEVNTERNTPYVIPQQVYPIIGPGYHGNNRDYSIGPGAVDFNGPRPERILKMNLLYSGSTPKIRLPIEMVPFNYYYSISALDISPTPTVTNVCYYAPGFPIGQLSFWPPIAQGEIEIFTNGVLTAPCSLNTVVAGTLPPAYQNWIVYEVAKRCQYLVTKEMEARMGPRNPNLAAWALKAKQRLQAINAPNPKMYTDFPCKPGINEGVFSNLTWAAGEPY